LKNANSSANARSGHKNIGDSNYKYQTLASALAPLSIACYHQGQMVDIAQHFLQAMLAILGLAMLLLTACTKVLSKARSAWREWLLLASSFKKANSLI